MKKSHLIATTGFLLLFAGVWFRSTSEQKGSLNTNSSESRSAEGVAPQKEASSPSAWAWVRGQVSGRHSDLKKSVDPSTEERWEDVKQKWGVLPPSDLAGRADLAASLVAIPKLGTITESGNRAPLIYEHDPKIADWSLEMLSPEVLGRLDGDPSSEDRARVASTLAQVYSTQTSEPSAGRLLEIAQQYPEGGVQTAIMVQANMLGRVMRTPASSGRP